MRHWSARTRWDLAETPWARELARQRTASAHLLDLTASNPTRCGFTYDAAATLDPLGDRTALTYEPDAKGLRSAREAISRYYRDHGASVDPDQIFLTTSTSEGYSFLFRLLCDPGDEVLIGQPGYPLFDFLAQLDDVRLAPYELFYDHGWHIDLEGLGRRVTARTRAITLIHPNNPTGHFTRQAEREAIQTFCRDHGLALIVDEVFLDYHLPGRPAGESFAIGSHPVPTFVLSGLSKIAALPQMKVSWIACLADEVDDTGADRLEVIADTFLSASAPIQCACAAWLSGRGALQRQIRERVDCNLGVLDAMLSRGTLVTRLEVEAGWYAVLRIPLLQAEEQTAMDLLVQRGVVVHSGGLFGFSGQGWLVVSLLGPENEFKQGVEAICAYFHGLAI